MNNNKHLFRRRTFCAGNVLNVRSLISSNNFILFNQGIKKDCFGYFFQQFLDIEKFTMIIL